MTAASCWEGLSQGGSSAERKFNTSAEVGDRSVSAAACASAGSAVAERPNGQQGQHASCRGLRECRAWRWLKVLPIRRNRVGSSRTSSPLAGPRFAYVRSPCLVISPRSFDWMTRNFNTLAAGVLTCCSTWQPMGGGAGRPGKPG